MTENQNPDEKQRSSTAESKTPNSPSSGTSFQKAMDELTKGGRINTYSNLTEWLRGHQIDSPKPTMRERLVAPFRNWWWATTDSIKIVGSKWKEILFGTLGVAALVVMLGFFLSFAHEGYYRLSQNVQIWPDEDSTTILHFTQRHWFTRNEEFRLEARPDPDDENRLKWMYQDKDTGKWYPMPLFDDGP